MVPCLHSQLKYLLIDLDGSYRWTFVYLPRLSHLPLILVEVFLPSQTQLLVNQLPLWPPQSRYVSFVIQSQLSVYLGKETDYVLRQTQIQRSNIVQSEIYVPQTWNITRRSRISENTSIPTWHKVCQPDSLVLHPQIR